MSGSEWPDEPALLTITIKTCNREIPATLGFWKYKTTSNRLISLQNLINTKRMCAAYRVEDEDRRELTEAVQSHVPKETEGGDQGTSTLSVKEKRKDTTCSFCFPVAFAHIF